MKDWTRRMRAEVLKMRHTFLLPLHAALPLLGSAVFLLYYRVSGWSERMQISGYMECVGAGFPFVIGIICAGNIGLEEQNHFQVLLGGSIRKWKGFAAKCLVLSGLGLLAVGGAVLLFGAGYGFIPGKEGLSVGWYLRLSLILFLGSIPMYLEHLFLSLAFSGTVSQCAGVVQSLLSALFLTGLGEGRWFFFPCTWSARGSIMALNCIYQGEMGAAFFCEIRKAAVICPVCFFLLCAMIGIWFHFYEGRQRND